MAVKEVPLEIMANAPKGTFTITAVPFSQEVQLVYSGAHTHDARIPLDRNGFWALVDALACAYEVAHQEPVRKH